MKAPDLSLSSSSRRQFSKKEGKLPERVVCTWWTCSLYVLCTDCYRGGPFESMSDGPIIEFQSGDLALLLSHKKSYC